MSNSVLESVSRLIPNLGALQSAITSGSSVSASAYRRNAYRLEQLPYSLGAALTALESAIERQENAIAQVDLSSLGPNVDYSIPNEQRDQIAYSVDAFLEASVRAQNAVWPYLQFQRNTSLPHSFRRLVEAVESSAVTFGGVIDAAILSYWAASGGLVRAYRDVSQHHVVLASDAHVIITNGVFESFFMPLPTNPTAKKPLEYIYDNESPNAIPYCVDAFFKLSEFIRLVTREILGSDLREPRLVSCHMFKEGSIGAPMRTGVVITTADLRRRLGEAINGNPDPFGEPA